MGKLQNEDHKSEAELVSAGGDKTQLLNDTKIYVTADGINKTLDDAILEGDIGGGGVGSPSIHGLFNGEDNDLTGFSGATLNTTTQLAGETSYDITFPGNAPVVTVPERSQNKLNQMQLQVRMTSGVCKFIVKDQSANILAEKEVDSDGAVILQYYLPDAVTSTQLFWENISSATGVTVDDIYSDDDPLNFRNTASNHTVVYTGYTENTGNLSLSTEQENKSDGVPIIEVTNAGTETRYTFLRPAHFTSTLGMSVGASSAMTIQFFDSTDTIKLYKDNGNNTRPDVDMVGFANTGDYLIATSTVASTNNHTTVFGVSAWSNDINLITSDSGTENVFSAKIANNGTASITSESFPFIQSVNRSGLGVVDIVFKTGFFTVAPTVISDPTNPGGAHRDCYIVTPATTSGVTIGFRNDGAGTFVDGDFDMTVQRQGDDYKDPHAFNLVQLQDQNENSSGARIANNGTASITSQGANWIQSVNRTVLGIVDVIFTPGFFTVPPVIIASEEGYNQVFATTTTTTTGVSIGTRNTAGDTGLDVDFNITFEKQGADYVPPSGVSAGPMQAVAVAEIKDVKANNTQGGTFTSGAWQTRDLNTISGSGFASINTNQFTLQKGTYEIDAVVPAYTVDAHKSKLRNITDSIDDIIGTSAYSGNAASDGFTTNSFIKGIITITTSKTFEIQHYCGVTGTTSGFGAASNFGIDEIYTQVIIRKLR